MKSIYGSYLKRPLDLVASVILLGALSPLLVAVALAVLATDGWPAIFRQVRPGRHERPFGIFKFRTMRVAKASDGTDLPDGQRLTPLGRLLRKTSLDELPELFNVVGGSMSLVGPRPLLMKYLPYYSTEERKRFRLRPGITGLAQVQGRNLATWDERLALDVHYHDNLTAALDAAILIRTIGAVLFARGVAVLPDSLMANLDDERRSVHVAARDPSPARPC